MQMNIIPRCVAPVLLCGIGLAQTPLYTFNGLQADDVFGTSVASAGDVDNDGFPDIVVGAPEDNAPFSQEDGYVRVYSGRTGALIRQIDGGSPGIGFGTSVSGAGDVNNDGFDDIVVGAPYSGTGGAIFVFSGQNGLQLFTFATTHGAALLGMSVSGAGDTNNDGFDDVIVGAPRYGQGTSEGRAWVLAGPGGSVLHTISGSTNNQRGYAVSGLGDLNSDGNDDYIVGSLTAGAKVFAGTTQVEMHNFTVFNGLDGYGASVAPAGDIDGDGKMDMIIGAPQDLDFFFPGEGYAHVRSGSSGSILHTVTGAAILDAFGASVSGAGDFDADGTNDFMVGATQVVTAGDGYVRIFSGVNGAILHDLTGSSTHDRFGHSIAALGDVDGDGSVEAGIGSPTADPSSLNASGTAHVLSGVVGNGGGGCQDPVAYCSTSQNSVGSGGRMIFSGSTSIANNDLTIAARGLPVGTQGLFIQGNSTTTIPFGDGVRCVNGPILVRLDPIVTTSATGVAFNRLDYPNPQLPVSQITAGSTWYFQFWYRDPSFGTTGFNFTDGLEATFCP